MKQLQSSRTLTVSAARAGMDVKTGRKYRELGRLPSECRAEHTWRTRSDPFAEVWDEIRELLEVNPGMQGTTILEHLQRRYPGRFADGQLRTLQRRMKAWRALEGPAREVFFPQRHEPGARRQSDFCHLSQLQVTIQGERFERLLYHFVLPYSNWETGTICFSESFESLSEGLQNALFALGGVPGRHRTDRLSAAVQRPEHPEEFTRQCQALLAHYRLQGEKIGAGRPHENGDVEQRHYRIRQALDQALMLRGSRDFASRREYEAFVRNVLRQVNRGRVERLQEELEHLRPLPPRRLGAVRRVTVRVGPGSTIRVQHNVYSVHSRLIGERVEVRIHAEQLELWYAQQLVETLPRMRGQRRHSIQYRHIIDWLVRKPGAFAQYQYRDDLFPTSRFRMAYDALQASHPTRAQKEYLQILHLAARETETGVDDALRVLLGRDGPLTAAAVEELVRSGQEIPPATEVTVAPVDLGAYDLLLASAEVAP
ncbi:MAG: IS21 family transposase [Anaerolineae bacterium]